MLSSSSVVRAALALTMLTLHFLGGCCELMLRSKRSFRVVNNTFLKDGYPYVVRGGHMDYFRVPKEYYRDRMRRLRALGLNTVSTYIAWNYHEREEGRIEHLQDIVDFLEAAEEEHLLVYLRPGPYICGEWDFGGFPAYLLAKPGLQLRSYEKHFISAVSRFWGEALPQIAPYTYSRGGPVALVQVENEFGYWGDCRNNRDDRRYMEHVLNLLEGYLGSDVVYTTNNALNAVNGKYVRDKVLAMGSPWRGSHRVIATLDGNPQKSRIDDNIRVQKHFNAPGNSPPMWSEFWLGWFTTWGDLLANSTSSHVKQKLSVLVESGVSFSMYAAHGGTNFGFGSGADSHDPNGRHGTDYESFLPDITSYDYSAPISEAGDHNIGHDGVDLFDTIRETLAQKYGQPPEEPPAIRKAALGSVSLNQSVHLFDSLDVLASCHTKVEAHAPRFPAMEELGQASGFILYTLQGPWVDWEVEFSRQTVHDRAIVYVDGIQEVVAYRYDLLEPHKETIPAGGKKLDVLVENMGHLNFNTSMLTDLKGLLLAPQMGSNWTATCLPLTSDSVQNLRFAEASAEAEMSNPTPTFRKGCFNLAGSDIADTFLDTEGLTKGLAWMNGHALGRFWEQVGPQHSLYVPAPFLVEGRNELILLDLEAQQVSMTVELVQKPRYARDDYRVK